MKNLLVLIVLVLVFVDTKAQNVLMYAGNSGKEVFYDVVQLSDGTFLIAGRADNLDWISVGVPRIVLSSAGIMFVLKEEEDEP